jgi:beta-phosphoglucomutase-like phosphatase (HAD superfamily)
MLARFSRGLFQPPISRLFATKAKVAAFDGAGTVFDKDSDAVITSFQESFAEHRIYVTRNQVKKGLGLPKEQHFKVTLDIDEVGEEFIRQHGRIYNYKDIADLYRFYRTRQPHNLITYSDPIPGFLDFYSHLRINEQMSISLNTMYSLEEVKIILKHLQEKWDITFDHTITHTDIIKLGGQGRPYPDLLHETRRKFGVAHSEMLVFGDTRHDMLAARNGGYSAVGVTDNSKKRTELINHGASYVIPDFTHGIRVLTEYNERLAAQKAESKSMQLEMRR